MILSAHDQYQWFRSYPHTLLLNLSILVPSMSKLRHTTTHTIPPYVLQFPLKGKWHRVCVLDISESGTSSAPLSQYLYPNPPPPQPRDLQHPILCNYHHHHSFHLPGNTNCIHSVLTVLRLQAKLPTPTSLFTLALHNLNLNIHSTTYHAVTTTTTSFACQATPTTCTWYWQFRA